MAFEVCAYRKFANGAEFCENSEIFSQLIKSSVDIVRGYWSEEMTIV